MFQPGNHQYRLDQTRRERLLQEAEREALMRKAWSRRPRTVQGYWQVLTLVLNALIKG